MHHAEPDELGVLQPGNHRQHACLLTPLQLRLKADQAEMVAGNVVLPQLHGGIRRPPGPRIDEADGFHRPEAQRVAAAMRHHLDRQTAFEEFFLVEVVDSCRFRGDERVVEPPYSSSVIGQFR